MKTKTILATAIIALVSCFSTPDAKAQWGAWGSGYGFGGWGGGWGGWGYGGWYGVNPALGEVKIDVDINFSGTIDYADRSLGNAEKRNPWGLVIGTNEMTKLMLKCKPNQDRRPSIGEPTTRMDFYKLVASLEVQGVNLADKKGRFKSYEEEVAHCGRVLVWLDSSRHYLLLDSSDPTRRRVEWPYASSVPPERVYVQAVAPTAPGSAFLVTYELDDSNKKCKIFGEPAIWDRVLVSAHKPGMPKPFVDRTPVWVVTGNKSNTYSK